MISRHKRANLWQNFMPENVFVRYDGNSGTRNAPETFTGLSRNGAPGLLFVRNVNWLLENFVLVYIYGLWFARFQNLTEKGVEDILEPLWRRHAYGIWWIQMQFLRLDFANPNWKLKTMLMQIFGEQTKCITGNVELMNQVTWKRFGRGIWKIVRTYGKILATPTECYVYFSKG